MLRTSFKWSVSLICLEMLFGFVGLGLIWYATNWMVVLGLSLALFGNNLGEQRRSENWL